MLMDIQELSQWNIEIQNRRATLLDRLLLATVALGLVAMIPLYFSLPKTLNVWERLTAMAPFVAGWLVLLTIWAWRGIGYRARVLTLLLLAYVLGIILPFARGDLVGSGRVWLLLPPVLAFVLLSPRSGIAAGAFSVLIYAFLTFAISQKWVAPHVAEDLTALVPLVLEGGSFLLVAAILTLILWSFNQNWLKALAPVGATNRRLQAQTRKLEGTNERLHRQISQLQATAEIAHTGSCILDPEKLLTELVNQVQEQFNSMGVYYAGLFLLDEAQQFAVLRAATGEAGQVLLDMDYKLELDDTSTIGRCIIHRQARVALGAGEDRVRFDARSMPHARSEIALPLRSHGRILGALSLQSTHKAAFIEDDIAVLQTMADQVAVAIENAVRFSQTEAALEELQAVQRRYLAQAWRDFLARRPVAQVDHTQPGTEPGDEEFLREARRAAVVHGQTVAAGSPPPGADGQAATSRAALVVPLKLRGQVIGTMTLHETDHQRPWEAEEIALAETIAEQTALTVENLRLMDETQRRAARERLTREITDKMRRATSVEGIVQTAVDELFNALGASRTFVRLGTTPPAQDNGGTDAESQIPNHE
jgi:GAF domain-containing protein